jgi:hypothetical protein
MRQSLGGALGDIGRRRGLGDGEGTGAGEAEDFELEGTPVESAFDDVGVDASGDGVVFPEAVVGAEHDDGDLGEALVGFHLAEDIEAVDSRHVVVEEDEVGGVGLEEGEGFDAIGETDGVIAVGVEEAEEDIACVAVIVDDKDHVHSLGSARGGQVIRDATSSLAEAIMDSGKRGGNLY